MDQVERLKARMLTGPEVSHAVEKTSSVVTPSRDHGPMTGGRGGRATGRDAVMAALDNMQAKYTVDGAEILGFWEGELFYFKHLDVDDIGSVYQILGVWSRVVPATEFTAMALFANAWNTERLWPKSFADLDEGEGLVSLCAETAMDFGPSFELEQLEELMNIGISTALSLFEAAATEFPNARLIESTGR